MNEYLVGIDCGAAFTDLVAVEAASSRIFGFGPPRERAPSMVAADAANGYLSPQSAARDYGVVVDAETLALDESATVAIRGKPPA